MNHFLFFFNRRMTTSRNALKQFSKILSFLTERSESEQELLEIQGAYCHCAALEFTWLIVKWRKMSPEGRTVL